MSSLVNHAFFFQPFQNLALPLTHYHYAFSKYVSTIALYSLWLVCLKFFSNPANPQVFEISPLSSITKLALLVIYLLFVFFK